MKALRQEGLCILKIWARWEPGRPGAELSHVRGRQRPLGRKRDTWVEMQAG